MDLVIEDIDRVRVTIAELLRSVSLALLQEEK